VASLRKLTEFVGVPPRENVSVCRDLLGFSASHPPGALFRRRPAARVSMNDFIRSFRRQHFHVRIINAGADTMSSADEAALDYAVYRLRDIYVNAGIGVGLILRQRLTVANSRGHDAITSLDGMVRAGADLTNDFPFIDASGRTVDGDRTALPVVIPANLLVPTTTPDGTVAFVAGHSPNPGPCENPGHGQMRSSVVGIDGESTGRTLAHEVGHFLGAPHPSPDGNTLMTQSVNVAIDPFLAVGINDAQRRIMLGSCKIVPGLVGVV